MISFNLILIIHIYIKVVLQYHYKDMSIAQSFRNLNYIIYKRHYLIPQAPFPPKTPLLSLVNEIK